MEFEFTEEQQLLRESLRRFLEAEIRPQDDLHGDREMTPELARKLCKQLLPWGYLGEAGTLGGTGDPVIRAILTEELARVFPGLAGISGIASAAAAVVRAGAHADVAGRLAEPMANGDRIGCLAISEPNVGSDASAVECRAELRGDRYVVNGTKCWISNGHIADVAVVVVQTEPGSGRSGLRQLVIDRRESPFESRDTPTIGMRSFPTSELHFENVEVPEVNRIGGWRQRTSSSANDPGSDVFAKMLRGIAQARVGSGLIAVGIAQRAFEIGLAYVRERKQFGKEIARFQLVASMIADMATEIDAARLLCYRAIQLLQRRRCDAEVSMAKAYATEMAVRVTSRAIQCMGSHGLATENRVERCLRDARMWTMPDGTTQIQKLIIGRALTGMSAIH
ncbi:MAG: acyl-CoA dehydrogenase family protein [Myxococcota bacterium]